jgi:hypothetical protein
MMLAGNDASSGMGLFLEEIKGAGRELADLIAKALHQFSFCAISAVGMFCMHDIPPWCLYVTAYINYSTTF